MRFSSAANSALDTPPPLVPFASGLETPAVVDNFKKKLVRARRLQADIDRGRLGVLPRVAEGFVRHLIDCERGVVVQVLDAWQVNRKRRWYVLVRAELGHEPLQRAIKPAAELTRTEVEDIACDVARHVMGGVNHGINFPSSLAVRVESGPDKL